MTARCTLDSSCRVVILYVVGRRRGKPFCQAPTEALLDANGVLGRVVSASESHRSIDVCGRLCLKQAREYSKPTFPSQAQNALLYWGGWVVPARPGELRLQRAV